ncbi:MAG TPA: hypothetical protein VK557_08615 [Pyrinomonadaceae bacterium]|nr:hypothetical protein [Pyrinomonadaceae bacterium]
MGRSGSIGNSLSRFIIVISALGIGLRLVMKGIISPERLVIFLVVVVIAAVIDSTLVKALLALFALGFFVLDYVNYDVRAFYAAIGPVLALLVALFGFFIMFGGLRRRR